MRIFGKNRKSDSDFKSDLQDSIRNLAKSHQDEISRGFDDISQALLQRDYQSARARFQAIRDNFEERRMIKKDALLIEQALQDIEKRIQQKEAKSKKSLTGTFGKAAIMTAAPIGLTMAASAVFPPAGFVVPAAFMIGGWISSGYKIHKENVRLEQDVPRLSVSDALKTGLKDKVSRLRSSWVKLANPLNLIKQEKIQAEIASENISNTKATLRALKNNAGHIGLVAGSVLGLGLKIAGLGDGIVDAVGEKLETLAAASDSAAETGDPQPMAGHVSGTESSAAGTPGPESASGYADGNEIIDDSSDDAETEAQQTSAAGSPSAEMPSTDQGEEAANANPGEEKATGASGSAPAAAEPGDIDSAADARPEENPSDSPLQDESDAVASEIADDDQPVSSDTEPSDADKIEAIEAAGMPIVDGVDLDLQYQMASVLPDLEMLSGESQQYFAELYDRMDSDNPLVQAQAFKDYADMTLNCLNGIDGLDNQALAYELAQTAVELGDGTNCQALNFLAYMELHGLGGEADIEAATQHYLASLGSHESQEAYEMLVYIAENNLVDIEEYPALADILEIHEQEMAASTADNSGAQGFDQAASSPSDQFTPVDANDSFPVNDDLVHQGEEFTVRTSTGDFNCTANQDIDIDDAAATLGANKDNLEDLEIFDCRPAA